MDVNAGMILQTYYRLRAKYGIAEPKFYRKKKWEAAELFLAWCRKVEVDPIKYLEFRFRNVPAKSAILPLYRLRNNRIAEMFKEEWAQDELAADEHYQKLEQAYVSDKAQTVRELRVLTKSQEVVKRNYWGRAEMCMSEHEISGGYHPSSSFCPTCPAAIRCAAMLYKRYGFDVVALRAGRVQALPKEIVAAMHT